MQSQVECGLGKALYFSIFLKNSDSVLRSIPWKHTNIPSLLVKWWLATDNSPQYPTDVLEIKKFKDIKGY